MGDLVDCAHQFLKELLEFTLTGESEFTRVTPVTQVSPRGDASELTQFLSEWPTYWQRRAVEPSTLPVLRYLPRALEAVPALSAALADALAAASPSLAWRRSYTAAAVGEAFYDNYGWAEIAGLTGPAVGTHLACGILLLGPHVTYPPHRHEAEEIYVPLSGVAEWQRGGEVWRERPPGHVIHHARHEPHAMRTGAAPVLALYLWRSDDLAQKSCLDPPR